MSSVGGTALCLACSHGRAAGLMRWADHCAPARCAALVLDTYREEGVLGAGSFRHLSSWAEMEPSKLGESPFACQAAKSDTATGPSGLFVSSVHREEPQGCFASKGDRVSGAPGSS